MEQAYALLAAACLALPAFAQDKRVEQGDLAFTQLDLPRAIVHYEEAAKAGTADTLFASKLARCYLDLRDLDRAERWFARSVASGTAPAQDLYDYAQVLRSNGKYAEADHWLARYGAQVPGDQRVARQRGSARYAPQLLKGAGYDATVTDLAINTSEADMTPAYWGNKVVFASARSAGRSDRTWNGEAFLDLYAAGVSADGALADPQPLRALNTAYHESNATFSRDGSEVWFTRNNFHAKKKGFNQRGEMDLRIYSRRLVQGEWADEQLLAIPGDSGSVCHPAISADGFTLFFASDRPGGHGGSDIWCVHRNAAGGWDAPRNLGPQVNTEGDEVFPYADASGDLYFASDGHAGLGGLDLYKATLGPDGTADDVVDLGAPLNGPHDDFALVLAPDGEHGYFTSDRPGGKGGDDLYAFAFIHRTLAPVGALGVAVDRMTKVRLGGVQVRVLDDQGRVLDSTVTDVNGAYAIGLPRGKELQLEVSLPQYRTMHYPLKTPVEADTTYRIDPQMAFLRNVGMWMYVTDSHTAEGIAGAQVVVIDVPNGNTRLFEAVTNKAGDGRETLRDVSIHDSLVYRVKLNRQGYFPKKGLFLYVIPDSGEIAMHHTMDISMDPIEVGMDASKAMDLRPIHFATARWDILPEAALELDNVVAFLKDNPGVTLELRGHCDSRGATAVNQLLSERRAESAAAYIRKAGVARDRVTSKGMGESRPLNRCTDGVDCSEEEFQQNRRTEFIVTHK